MEKKEYQVRIRKNRDDLESSAAKLFGACTVTEIKTLTGLFENLTDAFQKMSKIKELDNYEIISIILIDTDNSEQLDEEFDLDNNELPFL